MGCNKPKPKPHSKPKPRGLLALVALVLVLGVPVALADDQGIEVTCASDRDESTVVMFAGAEAPTDIEAVLLDCAAGLDSTVFESDLSLWQKPIVVDDPINDTLTACNTLRECGDYCDGQCAWRGGGKSAVLVDDLASTGNGKACSCGCRNGTTVYALCLTRPR